MDHRQHLLFKLIGAVLPTFFPLLIGLPGVTLRDHFLKLGIGNAKGLTDIQFFAGKGKMKKEQKIQKVIIGVLGNAAQKGCNFLVTADGKHVFPNIGTNEFFCHRRAVCRPQNKGVQPIAACYESIVPRIGGNIDRRAFVSCHLGKNKWVRVSFFIKSGGADKVLPFIHGNGKIVGSIKNLAEILIVFHKTRLRR